MTHLSISKLAIAISASMLLSACGGSSGGGDTNTGTGEDPNLVWVADQFKSSDVFVNRCATVRTGTDPYTGETYKDVKGSLAYEKMWLRSWNNETYLWYNEVDDKDPANYDTPQKYFDVLKTFATTDSGADKDNFHFYEETASYRERTKGGVSSGYGIRWKMLNNRPPRELLVVDFQPGSPAASAGFQRGDSIISVDGADFVNGDDVDTLNAGLFPENDGETHIIVVKDVLGVEQTRTVTSAKVEVVPVKNAKVINHAGTKVGYMQFDTHIAKAQDGLIDAIKLFRDNNVSELVVDLRYNGGGLLALASQFAYMVAGDVNTQGAFFERTIRNDKYAAENPTPFYTRVIDYDAGLLTNTQLPTTALNRVYVLSTSSTCSASEAFINGLRGIDVEVILVGGQTCGKPYGFFPTDNCSTTYFTIQFSGVNAKGFGEYSDGFVPKQTPQFDADVKGCPVDDDYTSALGDINEGMLSTALYHIENGNCPTLKTAKKQSAVKSSVAERTGLPVLMPDERLSQMTFNNKIVTPIK